MESKVTNKILIKTCSYYRNINTKAWAKVLISNQQNYKQRDNSI